MHHQKGGALVAWPVLTNVRRQFASQASVGFDKWPERNWAVMGSFVGRRAVFSEVPPQLEENSLGVFIHHLGHGVGLAAHAAPHLNPRWD